MGVSLTKKKKKRILDMWRVLDMWRILDMSNISYLNV